MVGLALLAMPALLSPSAQAAESPAVKSDRANVTLVSDVDSVAPGQSFRIGLRQRLAPHWHTYWKNPGDAGAATDISLTLPDGAKAGEIVWPAPEAINVGPVRNFGYEDEVVLPITVSVPQDVKSGQSFKVEAEANWLVCEKQCIPESGTFRLDLPVAEISSPTGGAVAAAFAASDARRPVASPWQAKLVVEGSALALTVEGEGLSPEAVKSAFYYPAEWGVIVHAADQRLAMENTRLHLAMTKDQAFNGQTSVAGVLAVTDAAGKTRWFEMSPSLGGATAGATPATAGKTGTASGTGGTGASLPGVGTATAAALSVWQAILFAFVGGLILNLMPCVFPVLAIKATSVAKLSGGSLREIRMSGLFYTLGVLSAFLALAGGLLALRGAGEAVGWGFQFQSPLFVAAMSWLLLAIGLNLSGVFEIGLGVTGTGQSLTEKKGHAGSFFTGLLAVVLATPCTAPFMGAAIGVALASPAQLTLALFAAMALGLAAPYALLVLFPRLATLLPRPGLWMVRLRQAMAFPMFASAAWLVWVLTRQVGDLGVMIALGGAVLIALAAWLVGIGQHSGRSGWLSRGFAAAAIAGLIALLPFLHEAARAPAVASASSGGAEAFSSKRLAELRQAGKPVFVNMTAAWCITCLVNERTTLSTQAVQDALRSNGITYLKGDWTNQDPDITAFLRGFNRDGLPFYAFYPAGQREPVVLPAVLTEALVLGEIQSTTN